MATFLVWSSPPGQESAVSALGWIFEDPRSRTLLGEVEQVASSDAAVLISGETNMGKELIARYLHNRSARQRGSFVMVSCDAFPDTLVGAELFSHENGALADAFDTQVRWFEQANGGTVFLDEINDLPLPVQNKLLRVLQEREIAYLGGCTPIPVNLRVTTTITVDLETLVREKCFRKDLYYRLDVINLNVLTLEERSGDTVPLACYFINTCNKRLGCVRATLTLAAERLLTQDPWHGNTREPKNVAHRTLLLCDGNIIDASELKLPSCSVCAQAQIETNSPIVRATASTTQSSVPYSTDEADPPCQAI